MSETRQTDYSTARDDGTSFIGNQWVFTGPEGYRVKPQGELFSVLRYTATEETTVFGCAALTEDAAHETAQRMSGHWKKRNT